jgi:hypothetical protein
VSSIKFVILLSRRRQCPSSSFQVQYAFPGYNTKPRGSQLSKSCFPIFWRHASLQCALREVAIDLDSQMLAQVRHGQGHGLRRVSSLYEQRNVSIQPKVFRYHKHALKTLNPSVTRLEDSSPSSNRALRPVLTHTIPRRLRLHREPRTWVTEF